MNVVIVSLGTHGVDFTTDFLGYKSEFTTGSNFFLDSFDKVFTMVGKTNFLFRDIKFLKIIDDFREKYYCELSALPGFGIGIFDFSDVQIAERGRAAWEGILFLFDG